MIELFLLISLILLFVLVRKPFQEKVLGGLDQRAAKIRHDLDEAERLHEEAKEMLAKYKRQLEEGETLAKEIEERAESDRRRMEASLREEMETMVERRTRQAEERIAQEEQRAVREVRSHAATLAVVATRQLLAEKMQGDQVDRVMKDAIDEVTKKLAS